MEMTKISVNIASHGVVEPCEIILIGELPLQIEVRSMSIGVRSFFGNNLFEALVELRLELERQNRLLLCNAARKDCYPSRMSLEMGGGRQVYLFTSGIQAKKEDLVDAFGAATVDQVCTVVAQRANYENWIRSLK